MAGNKAGGIKARNTNKRLYGKNFYGDIGRKGGKASGTGGFYANRDLARIAGAKGGRISRRGPAKAKKVAAPLNEQPAKLDLSDIGYTEIDDEPFIPSKHPWKRFFK